MADVQDPVGETTPAGAPGGADPAISSPSLDPERYAQLEAYYSRTNPILEKYHEDFNRIVEADDDERDFLRKSGESYKEMRARLAAEEKAKLPPEHQLLRDEILGELKPALEEVGELRKERTARNEAQARTATEASQEFAKKETEYANRLVAEQKLTSEEVNELAEYAMTLHQKSVKDGNPRFVGIEEVYKRVYGRAEAKVTAAKPVPRSQRAVAGATGVPGASRTIEDRSDLAKPGGVTRHILGVLNNQRKTG